MTKQAKSMFKISCGQFDRADESMRRTYIEFAKNLTIEQAEQSVKLTKTYGMQYTAQDYLDCARALVKKYDNQTTKISSLC